MDTSYPDFADKVQHYPEYYWNSQQASDYVYHLSYQTFETTLDLNREPTPAFNTQAYADLVKTAFLASPHLAERADRSLFNVLNNIGHSLNALKPSILDKTERLKENLEAMVAQFSQESNQANNAQLKEAFDKMTSITQSFMQKHFPANHLDAIQKIRQDAFSDRNSNQYKHF